MTEQNSSSIETISDPQTWVDKHGDFLYRYALLRLSDSTLAEDAVQETFLAALKAKKNFAGQSAERTWFVGILKHKIIDQIRKLSREVKFEESIDDRSLEELDFHQTGERIGAWKTGRRPQDWMIDPHDAIEQSEFWKFLRHCLSELPARTSLAFALREMEEMSTEEICNILKLSATNLRVTLHRARGLLRRCLEKNWIAEGKKK